MVAYEAVLFDLLMGVMRSVDAWTAAARDTERGLAWRDAAAARMASAGRYVSYDAIVEAAATDTGLPPKAPAELWRHWELMEPWPDASAVEELECPFAFLTNCSSALARTAVARSGLSPAVALSAEETGWYKPAPEAYRAALAVLQTTPGRVLYVAGSGYDAAGAHRAGLATRWVLRRADDPSVPMRVPRIESLHDVVTEVRNGLARSRGSV